PATIYADWSAARIVNSTMEKLQYGESRAQESVLLASTCSSGYRAGIHIYLPAVGSPLRVALAHRVLDMCLRLMLTACRAAIKYLMVPPRRGGTFHFDTCRPADEPRSDL